MTRLYVPACGDRLTLAKDWKFTLYLEHRNVKFAQAQGLLQDKSPRFYDCWSHVGGYKTLECTLPAGTVLECDRVYIRTFNKAAKSDESDFDSITWKVVGTKKTEGRFWAKLRECNQIEFALPDDASFKERAKVAADLAAKEPVRLDASQIRNIVASAYHGHGAHAQMFKKVREQALQFYAESCRLDKEAFDAWRALRQKEHDARQRMYGYMYTSYDDTRSWSQMKENDFLSLMFDEVNSMCAHSKRKDGTHVRKFYWVYPPSDSYFYYHSRGGYGHAGLSFTVTTDDADQNIIDMQFCDARTPRPEK